MEQKREKLYKFLIAALAIALCIAFAKISALERKVKNVQGNINSRISYLDEKIDDIYWDVDQRLEEKASIISGMEVFFGDFHKKDYTVDVTLSVVPKVIAEEAVLNVSLGDQTVELTRQANCFTGTVPVDVFARDSQLLLSIAANGTIQTEYIRDVYLGELWYKFIPSVYSCDCDIIDSRFSADGKYSIKAGFYLNFSTPMDTPGAQFEKFVLVTRIDGVEVSWEDITADVLNDPGYASGVHHQLYEKEYDTKDSDELLIQLEATDSLGYVHKMVVHHWKQGNGATAEAVNGSEVIYNADGKLLYGEA